MSLPMGLSNGATLARTNFGPFKVAEVSWLLDLDSLIKCGNREKTKSNKLALHVDCGDDGWLYTFINISSTVADGIVSI